MVQARKKKSDVPRTGIVRAYSRNMGGTDLCDSFLLTAGIKFKVGSGQTYHLIIS
jgi:hypothetical protein